MKKNIWIGILIPLIISSVASAEISNVTINVKGVACQICNNYIEAKLKKIPGTQSVKTNFKKSNFVLTRDPQLPFDYEATKKAVKDSGYTFESISLHLTKAKIVKEGIVEDPDSQQTFQLMDAETEPISSSQWQALKTSAQEGELPEIVGKLYPGTPLKIVTTPQ